MSANIKIEFNKKGFVECLQGAADMCASEAEKLAERYMAQYPGTLQTEVVNKPRFGWDASNGTTRPVAYARIVADATASREEAENKSMSEVVYQ